MAQDTEDMEVDTVELADMAQVLADMAQDTEDTEVDTEELADMAQVLAATEDMEAATED
jgi:hypothetical protein